MENKVTLEIDPEFIRPLNKAENEFIQVLLTSFSIRQGDEGLILDVDFDNESLAIWLREGKNHILNQLDPELIKSYQSELESILLGKEKKDWFYNNPSFPFRFGNGGTLPVIRYGDKDYYCFFYRDISPVGWNIANGGADSLSELLYPLATIERELREELIIVDDYNDTNINPSIETGQKCLYVFDWSEGRRPDHPDFAIARRVWQEIFNGRDFKQLIDRTLPLKWLSGHDSVFITFNHKDKVKVSDCILNINAEDFGIEIDRVAKMAVGPNAILCDGELSGGKLLNQVVGLFEVHRFNAALNIKEEFSPDLTFWHGENRSNDDLHSVVNEYLNYVTKQGIRTVESRLEWEKCQRKFGLCPVTRNLIRRYLLYEDKNPSIIPSKPTLIENQPLPFEVFLSFPSEDLDLASKVFSHLRDKGYQVFFSNETLHKANFADEIDNALRAARSLVIVASETDRFYKNWVRYEWQSFHNDILANRKPWETPFITFTAKPDKTSLPRPLVFRQIIDFSKGTFDDSLRELTEMLTG